MFHLRPIFLQEKTTPEYNQDTKDKITSLLYEMQTKSGKLFSELTDLQAPSLTPHIIARLEDLHDLTIYLHNIINQITPCPTTNN